MNCPYGRIIDDNDGMKMVWHNNEFAQFHLRMEDGNFIPFLPDHLAQWIQPHFKIYDVAKQRFPVMGDEGDEVFTRLGIIISRQADGAAVGWVGVCHV